MAEDLSYIGEGTDLEPIAEEVAEEEPATPERLQEITTKAALEYSLRHFSQAAELYSTACQLQDELHGEMAPENAELFYLYGRALYKVAVQNSDVLGGQVAAEKKKTKANGKAKKPAAEEKSGEEAPAAAPAEKATPVAGTPYFQITGMENWDSDEEDDEDADGEAEDEEDDFATAYEILDVSRVLFERQLEGLTNGSADTDGKGKGKATGASSSDTKVKERLSDVYDLQAEISLENERFADAIPDFRSALALKLEFHPKESSLIAEAHYKLSLALEFASVTALREAQAADGENAKVKKEDVDEEMREEAAKQMELAIESCKLRLTKEKDAMASMTGEEKTKQEKSVAEVQEIVGDMEQRLHDLRAPAISSAGGSAGAADAMSAASSIFAQALGETTEEQRKRIVEATKTANDLSGLVKRKKPKVEEQPASIVNGGSTKRKLDDVSEAESESKKTKV